MHKKTYHILRLPDPSENAPAERDIRHAFMKARFGQIDDALRLDLYEYSGSVQARNEQDAFYKTQAFADGVSSSQQLAQGAMGVGDVVVDTENGDAWMCATCGWEILSWDRCADLLMMVSRMQENTQDLPDPEYF